MAQSRLIRPDYSASFRCIGPECEDSCCQGWTVIVDQTTYEKYQSVSAGPLRILIDENIVRTPDAPVAAQYAKIRMPESLVCPFLAETRLCRIHAELGEEFLSKTCATYPRIVSSIDNLEEKALSLSCPEAARMVLLDPGLMDRENGKRYDFTWDSSQNGEQRLLPYFWPIREFVFTLVRDRAYSLWQRLFLLGSFCRRLDTVARGETDRGVAQVLRDFPAAVASGTLRPAMEKIPADLAMQLDMVLQLAGLCRDRRSVNRRFLECLEWFRTGIGFGAGIGSGATMETLTAGYAEAHDRWFAPLFAAHPHVLENYLINAIFRRQFPFGSKNGKLIAEPEMAREFALLATQFALIKGLLIGVAGCHRQDFSAAHVVHTVQTATKHFEHHAQFLEQMHALLVSTGRDNAQALTMLLRN